jgi:hypothetical protein
MMSSNFEDPKFEDFLRKNLKNLQSNFRTTFVQNNDKSLFVNNVTSLLNSPHKNPSQSHTLSVSDSNILSLSKIRASFIALPRSKPLIIYDLTRSSIKVSLLSPAARLVPSESSYFISIIFRVYF